MFQDGFKEIDMKMFIFLGYFVIIRRDILEMSDNHGFFKTV